MKRRVPFIFSLWLLVDLYFFQALRVVTGNIFLLTGYWIIDIVLAIGIWYAISKRRQHIVSILMALMLLAVVPRLLSVPVLLVEDIIRLFRGFPPRGYHESMAVMIFAGIPFLALLFGLTGGRHHYQVLKETLYFDDLPEAFDGFTITQISDVHSGSFSSKKGVQKGLDLINAQQSDLILFTGDLVNNKATEMEPWIPGFAELKAPYGKYSVLGNHDYGDYIKWENAGQKYANLNRLKAIHRQIGFRLLLNEAVEITKDGQSIALIGVENWGKNFHQYGNLDKATANVRPDAFKVLMSHDPSHWDAVTLDHQHHIHLTLAGHTHGMQFGIEFLGFKWSPSKYIYPKWAGLYQQRGKYLYVNRGFGFLGFKGRVGIWPEITVIELRRKT